MKNAANSMLVTITAANMDEHCLSFKTYDPVSGSNGTFLIDAEWFARWFMEDAREHSYMDEDCGNIVKVTLVGKGQYLWRVWWMGGYDEECSGFIRSFVLSEREMRDIFIPGTVLRKTAQFRSASENPTAKLVFTGSAMKNIGNLKPPEKTALKKFLRRAFRWYNPGIVTVCADGNKDFFFRESGGMCGGIILHKRHYFGGDGLSYEMHT